uniref:MMS19 nucleotide excision repair protein n=1 Tax=Heterorhabditis bacteriophora TaxID=37862 RepID=A0A1I7XTF6_HETBA
MKIAIIRLLSAGLVHERAAFPLLVLGSALNINVVDDVAEGALKRVDIQACVDDPDVVNALMATYLGSASQNVKLPPNQIVSPGSLLMKQKILPFLTRSSVAPTTYMNNIKICLDGLSQALIPKLHLAALMFIISVLEKMPSTALKSLGPSLFTRIKKTRGETNNVQCICLIYRCLGLLGKMQPSLVFSDMDVIAHIFSIIDGAAEDIAYAMIDCLISWLPGFCKLDSPEVAKKLKILIEVYAVHDNSKCRMVALKYVEALLSSEEMDLKWMLLNACGDRWCCSRYIWALAVCAIGSKPELHTVEGDENWMAFSPRISKLISEMDKNIGEIMSRIALQAIRDSHDVHIFRIATCFVSSTFVVPPRIILSSCLQRARGSVRVELASTASFLLAHLLDKQELLNTFEQTMADLEKNSIAGLCWLSAEVICAGDLQSFRDRAISLHTFLVKLAEEGYDRPSNILESALGALAVLFRTFHAGSVDFVLSEDERERMLTICQKISASRKDTFSIHAREAAICTIGLSVTSMNQELFEKVLTALFSIGIGPPQPELQLTTGAALWDAAFGPYSSSRRQPYLSSEDDFKIAHLSPDIQNDCESRLTKIVLVLLNEKLTTQNHHVRRAALAWLLVIVQRGMRVGIRFLNEMVDRIQTAFADGLTENDVLKHYFLDFSQDIASKGMGTVYKMATVSQRKSLVNGLMLTLSNGRNFTTKIEDTTVVFEEGQLGKSPDGDNLTTYKELCSLATDLNQPDLIYKFMQLAKHNATWNSKKGAAFGFGVLLEQARDELDPYVKQLVPKLFRYRYDPDVNVQRSMRAIWNTLMQTRRNVVEEYADDIARELIPQLTNKEWRVRESACLALSDLLRSNDTPYMHSVVPDLLETVFRIRDDIKESVRLASERTIESLRKLVIKLSTNSSSREISHKFISQLLPILIEKGLQSSIQINRDFSLLLLIDLTKSAGPQMRPYLADLIPCLLDAISDSESSILNYIAVRSNSSQLESLDDARSYMAKTSPMMTAIYDVTPYIDSGVLIALQPRVCDQLRASVGISTRAAATQFITNLALRAPQLLLDHTVQCGITLQCYIFNFDADKFFHALCPGLRDRNRSLRKQFANCISYLAKFTSSSQMEYLVRSITKDLLTENDDSKQSAKHVLKSLLAHCPELLNGYATLLVPFVFLEKCQQCIPGDNVSKQRLEEWTELWKELVPSKYSHLLLNSYLILHFLGTEGAVRLYRKEILTLGIDTLKTNAVWSVRAQAGRMLAETAEVLGEGLEADEAASLITLLLPLLTGRIWKGKEDILGAISSIVESAGEGLKKYWSMDKIQEIFSVLSREASKRNKEYASAALQVCAVFADKLSSTAAAEWLTEKIISNMQKILNPSERSSSEEEEASNLKRETQLAKFAGQNVMALARGIRAYNHGNEASYMAEKLCWCLTNPNIFWKAKQELVSILQDTVEKWNPHPGLNATLLAESLLTLAEEMYSQQRKTVATQFSLILYYSNFYYKNKYFLNIIQLKI